MIKVRELALFIFIFLLINSNYASASSLLQLKHDLAIKSGICEDDLLLSQASLVISEKISRSNDLKLLYYNFSYNKNQIIAKVYEKNKGKYYLIFDIATRSHENINLNSTEKLDHIDKDHEKIDIIKKSEMQNHFKKHVKHENSNNNKHLKSNLLIKKGQKINIIYHKGNLTIETEGIALDKAYKEGESIKVKLLKNNKIAEALVIDAQNVALT